MASYYLTAPEASTSAATIAAENIIDTLGAVAKPSMLVFRARRAASQMHDN